VESVWYKSGEKTDALYKQATDWLDFNNLIPSIMFAVPKPSDGKAALA